MLTIVPNAFAEDNSISLEVSPVGAPEKGWYGLNDVFEIKGLLYNNGDSTSIETDPSCGEILKIWNDQNLIFDGETQCRGQSRGLDISANSEIELSKLSWDFTNYLGELVPSGEYTVEYIVSGEGISNSIDIIVLGEEQIDEGLEIVTTITSRTGVHEVGVPSILSVKIHNTLMDDYVLPMDYCKINIDLKLFDGCEGGFDLSANQIKTLIQTPIIPTLGENSITVSLGENQLSKTIQFSAIADSDDQFSPDLDVDLIIDQSAFTILAPLNSEIRVSNTNEETIRLNYTNTCRGEIWIVDSVGNVVMDTRNFKECNDFEMEHLLENGDIRQYNQPEWQFLDQNGCLVRNGEMTIVGEIPEFDLFDTGTIEFTASEVESCNQSSLEIDTEISDVDEKLVINTKLVANEFEDITWIRSCGFEITIIQNGEFISESNTICDHDGSTIRVTDELSIGESTFDIDDGDYTILLTSHSIPQISKSLNLKWPIVVEEDNVEVTEEIDEENKQDWIVSGTWSSISTENGECWVINSNNGDFLTLSGAPNINSWMPVRGVSGQYVVTDSEDSLQCTTFDAQSFTIIEIISETVPETTEQSTDNSDNNIENNIESGSEEISPIIVNVGIVVASSGLLSLLFASILTNETWRIPATSAGLWLLGLIGKTSETTDGRYQRGRLIGYLTANPGCHFRALMAALKMSNGQITHHLKVLENEDSIWRRSDGRLVRFYPFTDKMHPGIEDDDLPIPPLSPDPNSLQGKILRLLDDDGSMGEFPTQSELADRLDRSQQLVSHHLRTLQKFGLVEKRKMGLRNRYRLTKEASFLLDSNEF